MPISFNSIQDQFGIGQLGNILGQALMQKNMERLQNQRQLESEGRSDSRQKQLEELQYKRKKSDLEDERKLSSTEDLSLAEVMKSIPQNANINDIQTAYLAALSNKVPPEKIQKAFSIYSPILKEQAKGDAQMQQLKAMGFNIGQPQAINENVKSDNTISTTQGQSKSGVEKLSDEQLVQLGMMPQFKGMAQLEIARRDTENKKFQAERKYNSEISTPYMLEINKEREALRNKRFAVPQMQEAIEQGNFGFFSLDNLSNLFHIEGLRTASGAKLVGAAKEFLLSNIARAGARPNQWIEQQIAAALPQVGQKKEAAATLAELLRAEVDLQSERVRIADELGAKYEKEMGFVPRDIGAQVDAKMRDYEQFIQDRTAYRTRQIYEDALTDEELGFELNKKVPKGTPLTPRMGDLIYSKAKQNPKTAASLAEKLGYSVKDFIEIDRYNQ